MKNIKLFLLTLSLTSGSQSFTMTRIARAFRHSTAALRTPAFKASAIASKPLAQPTAARSVASRSFSSRAVPAARQARPQVKTGFGKKTAFGALASSLFLSAKALEKGNSLPGETCVQARRKSFDKTSRREVAIQEALECARNPNTAAEKSLESIYSLFVLFKNYPEKAKRILAEAAKDEKVQKNLTKNNEELFYPSAEIEKQINESFEGIVTEAEKQINENAYGQWLVKNTDSSAESNILLARKFDLDAQFSRIAHHYKTLSDIKFGLSSHGLTQEQEQARIALKNHMEKIQDRSNDLELFISKKALPFDIFAPNAAKLSHQASRVQDIDTTKLWKSDGLRLALEDLNANEIAAINLRHALNMHEYNAKEAYFDLTNYLVASKFNKSKFKHCQNTSRKLIDSIQAKLKKNGHTIADADLKSFLEGKAHQALTIKASIPKYRKDELSKLDSIFDPNKREQYDLISDALYWRDVNQTETTKK